MMKKFGFKILIWTYKILIWGRHLEYLNLNQVRFSKIQYNWNSLPSSTVMKKWWCDVFAKILQNPDGIRKWSLDHMQLYSVRPRHPKTTQPSISSKSVNTATFQLLDMSRCLKGRKEVRKSNCMCVMVATITFFHH